MRSITRFPDVRLDGGERAECAGPGGYDMTGLCYSYAVSMVFPTVLSSFCNRRLDPPLLSPASAKRIQVGEAGFSHFQNRLFILHEWQ
jgi:hypothetical protein